MVDAALAAYSSSLSYTAQFSGPQETSSLSLVEQTSIAAVTTANGTAFGAAVTVSISASALSASSSSPAGVPEGDGEQALATLKQTAADAKGFLKKAAQQKLQIAASEIKLLKLLDATDGAREAAQLARRIADAASQYAEGSDPNDPDQAASSAAAAAAAAPSAAAAAQPSFFQQVDVALAALRKYLQKVLPALALSSDKDVRKTGETAKAAFDQAVAQAGTAEAELDAQGAAASQPVALSA